MDLPPRQAPSPSSAELYLLTARCDSRTLRDETSSAAILRPAKSRSEACVRSGVEERPSWKAKSVIAKWNVGLDGQKQARSK